MAVEPEIAATAKPIVIPSLNGHHVALRTLDLGKLFCVDVVIFLYLILEQLKRGIEFPAKNIRRDRTQSAGMMISELRFCLA